MLHVSGATVRHRHPFESLEVPRNEQDLSRNFIDKWVVPFYMTSLSNADDTTILMFADAAKEINVGIVKVLLGDFNWRTRIAGAFFAAINNYKEVEDIIGAKEGTSPGVPYMRFAFLGATSPLPGVYTTDQTTFGLEPTTVGLYIDAITYQFYAGPGQKVYVNKENGKLSLSFCSLSFSNPFDPSKPIIISANVTEP